MGLFNLRVEIRLIHLLVFVLMMVIVLVFNELKEPYYYQAKFPLDGQIFSLTKSSETITTTKSSSSTLENGNVKENNNQESLPKRRYTIIGYKGSKSFRNAVISARKVESDEPMLLEVKALQMPTKEKYFLWLQTRLESGLIGEEYTKSTAVVFVGRGNHLKFIGGLSELQVDISLSYPGVNIETTEPIDMVIKATEEPTKIKVISQPRPSSIVEPVMKMKTLVPQIKLKNKLITGYRAAEGKSFTNYKPLHQAFTVYLNQEIQSSNQRWTFKFQAPLLASIILVQDQVSAQQAALKNRNALINNIGWGGQSCYGGTKGAQMRCRIALAARDGCEYDGLGIQPPQYRLWIQDECLLFFESSSTCNNKNNSTSNNRLWIEKPSGGQHGSGMKVHRGCDSGLKQRYSKCPRTNGRKYFVMEYLEPALLLKQYKFDLRTYLLVGSLKPYLVFYHDGFVRKATSKYSYDLNDKTAHITNSDSQNVTDDHFWDFKRLEEHLHEYSDFPEYFIRKNFRHHAIKTSNYVFQASRQNMYKRPGTFQIFALDWIIDKNQGIHLLEANSNPLVKNYNITGFPETWNTMMDLVYKIHIEPDTIDQTKMTTPELSQTKRFQYKGWRLVFNEYEEQMVGEPYNACKAFKDKNIFYEEVDDEVVDNLNDQINIAQDAENDEEKEEESSPLEVEEIEDNSVRDDTILDLYHDYQKEYQCKRKDEYRVKCLLALGTDNETPFTIIDSSPDVSENPKEHLDPKTVMNILIVSGIHGNEGAGVVASRQIARHWLPNKNFRFYVIERANVRAVAGAKRYVPFARLQPGNRPLDLNRVFPIDVTKSPIGGELPNSIWQLVDKIKPQYMFDLHEGWGFYAELKQNYHKDSTQLVGSTTFSKGSSIIASLEAKNLAQFMVDQINETVEEKLRKFEVTGPPIDGGLAMRLNSAFNTKSMVLETTKKLPLVKRGEQQLIMMSNGLKKLKAISSDFDLKSYPSVEHCVVSQKSCTIPIDL